MLAWLSRLFRCTSMFRGDTQLELITVLANSGDDVSLATKAIRIYIQSKRRKNRGEDYIHAKIEDIENRYKFDTTLHEAFHVARAQTGLPRSTVLPPPRRARRDSNGMPRTPSVERESPRRPTVPIPAEPNQRPAAPSHPDQYPTQIDTPRGIVPPPAPQPIRRPSLMDTPRSFPPTSGPHPSPNASITDTPRSFPTPGLVADRSSLLSSNTSSPNFPAQDPRGLHRYSALGMATMPEGRSSGSSSSNESSGLKLHAGPLRSEYAAYPAYPREDHRARDPNRDRVLQTPPTPNTAPVSSARARRRTSDTGQYLAPPDSPINYTLPPAALDANMPSSISIRPPATPRSLMNGPSAPSSASPSTASSGSPSGHSFGPRPMPPPNTEISPITPLSPPIPAGTASRTHTSATINPSGFHTAPPRHPTHPTPQYYTTISPEEEAYRRANYRRSL
ncbi:hypothetical protein CALVIDRAFT_599688 [Calocera viscosa TUFC12733]|uniref:Uncharacterized protein n=1 Tax=Calocera viscosa (strain TUFC12733) TaxID=1330018 RepID=A0A167KG32_CALVF|nr:hypothetical protein CALVIDRAFT_599688 [Calocera viscosa TUFC12733]